MSKRAGIGTVAREWGRLGVVGFGGPPAHIVLLRQLCVERRAWISAPEFEDAIAVCNLLPGPASTQLAIYCASRVAGWPGAIVGGAGFILPGLTIILGLAALDDVGPVPRGCRAGADHSGAGGADRCRRRVCGVRRSRGARRRGDRVQPVVHPGAARPAEVRPHPHRLQRARAFPEGAGPAAILGAAVPLAGALTESWQYGVLAAAAVALLVLRRSVVVVLLTAAAIGLVLMWAGATIPG